MLSRCETAQTLTMCRADLAVAVSKLWRAILPSMARRRPPLVSCNAASQDSRQRSNSPGFSRRKTMLRRSCEGMPLERSRNRAQPIPVLTCPVGHGEEVVGPGDGGTQGDGDDVDEGMGELAPAGVAQAREVVIDARRRVAGHASECPGSSLAWAVSPPASPPSRHALIFPDCPSWRNHPEFLVSQSNLRHVRVSCPTTFPI